MPDDADYFSQLIGSIQVKALPYGILIWKVLSGETSSTWF
jgi:hypothetical protein